MTSLDAQNIDRNHIWHPFDAIDTPENIIIESAEGICLHTIDGRSIIDGIGSWWVNIHGHCHPKLVAALQHQVARLDHVIFSGFSHKPAIDFTAKLLQAFEHKFDKIFYSDNGSTATEVALKMAFQYWYNQGKSRTKVLAFEGAYHGDTFGAMAAGERSKFNEPFFPFLFDVTFVPLPNGENDKIIEDQVKALLETEQYASFIFEPLVLGAAGMKIYQPQVLDKLVQLCAQYGTITIADEVFTGFYRTGKLLASNYLSNSPDIVCLSKAITGGFMPLGATVCKGFIFDAFTNKDVYKTFFHGHSYTGNPLALALANASLDLLLEQNTLSNIQVICTMQCNFAEQLNLHFDFVNAQSLGTILSIEINNTASKGYFSNLKETIYNYFLSRNILLRPLGNILYFLPMYCFDIDQLNLVYSEIENFLITQKKSQN